MKENEVVEGNGVKAIVIGLIAILLIMLAFNSCSIVKPGSRGIKITMGSVSNIVLDEGLHLRIPFIQKIARMDVKIQKVETPAAAVSKDLQDINTTIAVNYHILPDRVNIVYKGFAKTPKEAEAIIISPKIQEIAKSVISKYNTLELISQRELVRIKIFEELNRVMIKYDIILDELSIVNFAFSEGFAKSIERKQIAEQDAITAQKKLEQIKFEAEQKIAEARGEAESNKLKQLTLTRMLIDWELAKKWDGKLPQVTGSGGTIISLPNVSKGE
jgi:regulator of protease activity HflC (stomatin/prohibitin superfamily)